MEITIDPPFFENEDGHITTLTLSTMLRFAEVALFSICFESLNLIISVVYRSYYVFVGSFAKAFGRV